MSEDSRALRREALDARSYKHIAAQGAVDSPFMNVGRYTYRLIDAEVGRSKTCHLLRAYHTIVMQIISHLDGSQFTWFASCGPVR